MDNEEVPIKIITPPGGSMYNMLFGSTENKMSTLVLALGHMDVGRYRDLFVETTDEADQYVLAVYTRNGGGNRESYAEQIAAMHAHPLFISDTNDVFDETYATFRFRFDPAAAWDAAVARGDMRSGTKGRQVFVDYMHLLAVPPVDTDERWKQALRSIGANVDE